ncbi:Gfo/Idh/MocA family protein [candidate division KSB1 bacterium]
MDKRISRRKFIEMSAASAAGVTLGCTAHAQKITASGKPLRIGIIGTGNRGRSLLTTMLSVENVVVPALCDIKVENLQMAQDILKKAGFPEAEAYTKNEYDFENLMKRDDLDAVIIATYWQWHTPMAVSAMKNGKYTAVEVPAAISLKECWDLVNTHEETGVPCMMLENWSFRRDNLAVLNMIRKGMFGEIVHCHCAHSHDCIDHWFFDGKGNDRWGSEFLVKYNRDQYPTHTLGPVLSWMNINCGDYFKHLTSTATASKSINAYFKRKFGADHPNATKKFKQGDIVTSVVETHMGRSIVINYDMQLPRPYDNRWLIQGTLGLYNEQRDSLYITDVSPEYHQWEPFPPYQEKYEHKWWKDPKGTGGHGGTDSLELYWFLQAVRNKTQTPIDIYDSVVMSSIIPLSEKSIANGSAPVECPDFTRGKWKTKKPTFAV